MDPFAELVGVTECPVCGGHAGDCSFLRDPDVIVRAVDLKRREVTQMAEHVSKERVFRPDAQGMLRLAYAEGDPIPASDTDELRRQGFLKDKQAQPKAAKAAKKAVKTAKNKAVTAAEDK